MAKERLPKPVIGDTVALRLFTFNGNEPTDVAEISEVEIWYLDPAEVTETNLDGRRLVATIDGDDVTHDDTGKYSVEVELEYPTYVIGCYIDIWHVVFEEGDDVEGRTALKEQTFDVASDTWHTSPLPVTYDFSFKFVPNRIRHGSCKYLIVYIIPNVPHASDLEKFYENIQVHAGLCISIEQKCGDCLPTERDLRMIVEDAEVEFVGCTGQYRLDTTDLACGIYDVWFTLQYGGNVYVSDTMQLQIY